MIRFSLVIFTLVSLLIFFCNQIVWANTVDPVEKLTQELEEVGQQSLKKELNKIRSESKKATKSQFKVSADILKLSNIEDVVSKKIAAYRNAIKDKIWKTAEAIENSSSVNIIWDNDNIELDVEENKSVKKLNDAIKKNNISLKSFATAIRAFTSISDQMYTEAMSAKQKDRKFHLYVEYTAFVYELSSVTLEILNEFKIEGIEELHKLHNKRETTVKGIKDKIDEQITAQKKRLEKKVITEAEFQNDLAKYNSWKEALDYSLGRWQQIFDTISKQKDWAKNISKQANVFEKLRDDAGIQLSVLKEIKVVDETFRVFQYLGEIVQLASNIPLLKLDRDVAEQLLGIDYTMKDR
ncbi:hypothetical protein JCM12294_48870 [Desulfocicer niacini]